MVILTIRTDNPMAEIGLFESQEKITYETWLANRELSMTIHRKIEEMLEAQKKKLENLEGIICFSGPGSFTGLRIGLSVGNVLAYGLGIPVIATQGKNWIAKGVKKLEAGQADIIALPLYGAEANITSPRK